ncbi:MAG TPA: biotin--[acetyl-CoA-carboxylase] ligase [Nitrosopumilaceae archaeon]|nr:biotin--[acetyl-CoA-carboxylase] ligase [Nitrosopumilaceae archaeon]
MSYNSNDEPGFLKVLYFLKSHNTEYLSGQDLSDVLRISRVAVWKHIKKIKELGYTIESKQKLGYRLASSTNLPLPWEITQGLKTKTIGKQVFFFDTLDSTQIQAIKMASDSKNNGAIIIAKKQTSGKGRANRKWYSPEGGIWLSIIIRPEFDISMITLFPIASATALCKAMEKSLDVKPELKWPNDITINGKKVAGILIDASLESNKIENIVLGIGINFDINVAEIEKKLENTPNFYGIATLKNYQKDTSVVTFVQIFLKELEEIVDLLNKGQVRKIINEWTKRSSTIGKVVEFSTNDGKVRGKAVKIDDDGALVVFDKKNIRVLSGDIAHL